MMNLNFKKIGEKIKSRRKYLGVTQEFIADQLEVNPSHISNIECGRANPSLTILVKMANVLQCSVDYFIVHEYTFTCNTSNEIENKIVNSLNSCDEVTKNKVLQIINILI